MFTIEKIQSLNELEMIVYQYVIQHQSAIPYMHIRDLASEAHVSASTIFRFCKKLGFDGYAEFKMKMKEYIGQKDEITVPEDLSEIKAFLDRMESASFQKKLDKAASIIARADRVLCVGVSNSGYIAQYAARYFSTFGKFSMALTDPFYPIWQFNGTATTVALVFSISGEIRQAVEIANQLKQQNCHVISITNSEKSTVAQLSELNLSYYITMRRGKADADFTRFHNESLIDYTSQAPALIVAETLAKRVARRLKEE